MERATHDLRSDTPVRRLHPHLHALVPVTLRHIADLFDTLQKRDIGVDMPMC